MYIQKEIELKKTGMMASSWIVDIRAVSLAGLPNIAICMHGYKDTEKIEEAKTADDMTEYIITFRDTSVTSEDLELDGSIGYANIPKLYEVLTTKTVEKTDEEGNVTTEPAYPDFFGGEIIETN